MAKAIIFAKTEVTKTLELIVRKYLAAYDVHNADNTRLMHLYSGMAVITLSGYLEDGMDGLVDITLKSLSVDGRKRLQESRGGIHGASYGHLSKRIAIAFGSHGLEFIESYVGPSDIAILSSTLGTLKKLRDEAAHSHKGAILRNPSMILSDFIKIHPILRKIEKGARLYRDEHFI